MPSVEDSGSVEIIRLGVLSGRYSQRRIEVFCKMALIDEARFAGYAGNRTDRQPATGERDARGLDSSKHAAAYRREQ